MKIAFETLGCKLNQAETEMLARQFVAAGHEMVTKPEDAEVFMLNTCTVTHTADAKARHLLSRVRRRNPEIFIVATGCYAEGNPGELAKYADLVVNNKEKEKLLEKLNERGILRKTGAQVKDKIASTFRTRAFVKIQDGCTNFCAYCIVPYVRGKEKSLPAGEIIATVKKLTDEDYQEVVLTGTRIGAYADGTTDLAALTKRVLGETAISRIRLSSLQPQEISGELLELWRDKRLCPHFHLSLQSGSETVLKRMNRRYTLGEYAKTVKLIRKAVPEVAITTDVIVGFPGESDAEFKESLEFCRQMEFARIHVFVYSPRAGTKAAGMSGPVNDKVKKARSQVMLAVAKESEQNFREKFSGELLDVLWEKQDADGQWSGVTGNYIRVNKQDTEDLGNRVSKVKLG
ncbi:MAG: tRNA (N(6)-L-threonylcarbamoyladenosine(37)-C(2))-methylthiotransferase MtaB [Dehalococcoidales bacterium]|nr:tRNA (N(6)-L-threonylcarbamoyladenosine(37)-C(2))-methylthiotransferase MtaB [Dehalococcoidales bacterium]